MMASDTVAQKGRTYGRIWPDSRDVAAPDDQERKDCDHAENYL